MTATPKPPSLSTVYDDSDGRSALGFILTRATGFEAFDREERSLGVYDTLGSAAEAILCEQAL